MKKIFDLSVEVAPKSFGPFKELLVSDLDPETIWEEIQSQNRPLKRYFKAETNKLLQSTVFKSGFEEENEERSADGTDPAEEGLDDDEEDGEASFDEGDMELDDDGDSEEDTEDEEEQNDYDEGETGDGVGDAAEDGSGGEEMEAWLDEMEELEDKHRRRMERLEQSGGSGHKGAVEVRACRTPECTNNALILIGLFVCFLFVSFNRKRKMTILQTWRLRCMKSTMPQSTMIWKKRYAMTTSSVSQRRTRRIARVGKRVISRRLLQ